MHDMLVRLYMFATQHLCWQASCLLRASHQLPVLPACLLGHPPGGRGLAVHYMLVWPHMFDSDSKSVLASQLPKPKELRGAHCEGEGGGPRLRHQLQQWRLHVMCERRGPARTAPVAQQLATQVPASSCAGVLHGATARARCCLRRSHRRPVLPACLPGRPQGPRRIQGPPPPGRLLSKRWRGPVCYG